MNDDLAETMAFVLSRRNRMLLYKTGKQLELLGETPHLAETLREAQALKLFTAPELAEKLEIEPSTANKRLEKLLESGAVRRERERHSEARNQTHLPRCDPENSCFCEEREGLPKRTNSRRYAIT